MSPDRLPSRYQRLVHTGAIILDPEVRLRKKPSLPNNEKGRNRWVDTGRVVIAGLVATGLAVVVMDQIGRISDALSDAKSKSAIINSDPESYRTYRLVQKP